jgi:uncharacterized membrane protein YccC
MGCALTRLTPGDVVQAMSAAIRTVFSDPAFRYGLKFGLAGVLAVFLALLIRLEEPTWALFTVFVLMIAQFVGAIAEKSVFRIIGTTAGAILGYLITAAFEQQPLVFLLLIGGVVGFCTAMFGQSRYPYAFLLCGLTITVVASNGLGNPDFSWQFALWRVEEVTLGILVAIVVQSLIWPRFAREEFAKSSRAAFADLRACFQASAEAVFSGGSEEAVRRAEDFPARISVLRSLLDFGARESQYFRDRLPTYFEITNCLSRIASAIATLSRCLPPESFYHEKVRKEAEAIHQALGGALDDLADKASSPESRARHRARLKEAFDRLEIRLKEVRSDPRLFALPAEETMAFGLHLLAADEIRQQIERAHELLDSLPAQGDLRKPRNHEPFVSPYPPPFWIRSGIKAAIAVIAAFVLVNWLHPPGGSMLVLGAWVMTSLNATSPGGRGDWRAFHYVVYSLLVLMAVSLLLIAIRPLLSSYAVMNTIIFTWLFVWGYISFSTRGMTIPMQISMLMIVGILGLNGQEPIAFQAIVDFFFGLALSLVLAALIQRLIWPSLPQWELRDRLLELLRLCRRVLTEGPSGIPLWQKTRIALIPGEAGVRISRLTAPVVPAGEQERLRSYLNILRRVGAQLAITVGRIPPLLPAEYAAQGREQVAGLEAELRRHLAAHEASLTQAEPPAIDSGELNQLLKKWRTWVSGMRVWMLSQDFSAHEIIRLVGLSARYDEAAQDLLRAGEEARRLKLADYMGDYSL